MPIPSPMHRPLKIAVAALLAFVAAEFAVSLLPLQPYVTNTELLVAFQAGRAREVRDGDIVLLGDSTLGNAVDEQALSAALGTRCWNLSLVGFFGPDGDGYLLRELRRRGVRPRAVVLMHDPAGWTQRYSEIALRPVEQELGESGIERAGSELFGELPSVRVSRSCKKLLFSPGDGLKPDPRRYRAALANGRQAAAGLSKRRYIAQGETLDWTVATPVPWVGFETGAASEQRLRDLVELAAAGSHDVFLATGPSWAGRANLSTPYLSALEVWLQEICTKNGRAQPLYIGTPQAPNSQMGDSANHLNERGRAAFTAWLAAVLRARLEGSQPGSQPPPAWRGKADS